MPRAWLAFFAACLVEVLSLSSLSGAATDRGRDRPPAILPEYFKSIWMEWWGYCWAVPSMTNVAQDLKLGGKPKYKRAKTPQAKAVVLAHAALVDQYPSPIQPEMLIGREGCRNGLLWRHYGRR